MCRNKVYCKFSYKIKNLIKFIPSHSVKSSNSIAVDSAEVVSAVGRKLQLAVEESRSFIS